MPLPGALPDPAPGAPGGAHYAAAKDYRRWTVPHQNFHRALTAPAGERINDLLGQLFDHAERYRRLDIGHGPTPWATAGLMYRAWPPKREPR